MGSVACNCDTDTFCKPRQAWHCVPLFPHPTLFAHAMQHLGVVPALTDPDHSHSLAPRVVACLHHLHHHRCLSDGQCVRKRQQQ